MAPRTRVVIQSRLNSSRLPGKALMRVGGMPLIELVARRAARTGFEVIVATSVENDDERIADHLTRVGIPVMRGDLDDVLGRFVTATADLGDDDLVVRLTGDNPVADADLIAELAEAMASDAHAYGRVDIEQVPEGLGCEIFTAGDLRRAASEATAPYDREHVTPWLRRELGELLFAPAENPTDVLAYRATIDCLNDYVRVSRLFDGEPDPVGVPWSTVMSRLVTATDALGSRPGRLEKAGITGSRVFLGADAAAEPEALRSLGARAADTAVTHILGTAPAIAAATLPALRQRLGALVVLPALPEPEAGPDALVWQVRALVAQARAELQGGALAGVLFASADDALAGAGAAWAALRALVDAGQIGRAGVVGPDERAGRLTGLDLAVTRPGEAAPASGQTLVLVEASNPEQAAAAFADPRTGAVVAQAATTDDLADIVATCPR